MEQPKHEGHELTVVANCKLKNVHCNLSVNDCLERPPNALVLLLKVLLWWRTNLHMLMLDLARAYQALQTGPMERFTRLFLWRRTSGSRWQTYGYNRVMFGDQPAAAVLEVAKSTAADLGKHIHPYTAWQLRNKVYVNNGPLEASSREELQEMRGKRREDRTYNGFISRILSTCSMAPKYITVAGEAEEVKEHAQLGGAMLGVEYNIRADRISFSFPPHTKAREEGYKGTSPAVTSRHRPAQGRTGKLLPEDNSLLRDGPVRPTRPGSTPLPEGQAALEAIPRSS